MTKSIGTCVASCGTCLGCFAIICVATVLLQASYSERCPDSNQGLVPEPPAGDYVSCIVCFMFPCP